MIRVIDLTKISPRGASILHRLNGPLARYVQLRVADAPGMPGTFSSPITSNETVSYRSRHASRHVRDARAVMHVGIANPRMRGKRYRHSGRMRNPRFYVFGKRPIGPVMRKAFPYHHVTMIIFFIFAYISVYPYMFIMEYDSSLMWICVFLSYSLQLCKLICTLSLQCFLTPIKTSDAMIHTVIC